MKLHRLHRSLSKDPFFIEESRVHIECHDSSRRQFHVSENPVMKEIQCVDPGAKKIRGLERLTLKDILACLEEKENTSSFQPSVDDLVHAVRKCMQERNLNYALRLHAHIQKNQLESHGLLGDYLVFMFIQVGSMQNAQMVFDRLDIKKESTWNSLINGYIVSGESQRALILYQKMKEDSLQPDARTFVSLLKACAKIKDVKRGCELHVDVSKNRLIENDIFVGSTLIYMYTKCGSLAKAHNAFEELPIRNVVSWNALISGYANNECSCEALDCFQLMRLEAVTPNAVTFTSCVKACATIGAIDMGLEFHHEIDRQDLLNKDHVLGGALVDMYAKLGMLSQAQEVFDNLSLRNVISWNALIVAYAKCGQGKDALTCFEKMRLEGVHPDFITFASAIKACADTHAIEKGSEIYLEISRAGLLGKDIILDSALVDMYAKCGMLEKAQMIFDKLKVRDVISWTALIAGYVEEDRSEEALKSFEQMKREHVSPDAVTFACSLKACGSIGAVHKGNEIHDEIQRKGMLGKHLIVDNALLDMYTKFGLLGKAQEIFDRILCPDIVSWNTLITGYGKYDRGHEVLKYFEKMQRAGVKPDAITFTCSLKACGSVGSIEKGREIHAEIDRNGLLETNLAVCNSIIDMYAKCGFPIKAKEVFDKLPFRDLISWNTLIAAYAQAGDAENVFMVFEQMKEDDMKPDSATFTYLLSSCSHGGLVDHAQIYFGSMSNDYGIIPNTEQHTCFVDLLGRAGQLDKAVEMMIRLPFHPDLAMWCTVLGACRKWGNLSLAKQAFEYAVRLDEKESAPYVCMYNIYADANMHEDAKRIEELRVKKQAWTKRGSKWWSSDIPEGADKVEESQNKKKEWRMLLLD